MGDRVAVAAVSRDAARAGTRTADRGGNAVDAALAAGIVSAVTHPGMCSLGGGAFVTVWPEDGSPAVVDGGLETPGRGLDPAQRGGGGVEAELDYAGGVRTVVGPGSVAVPGLPAACAAASRRYGRLPWEVVLEPAVERARRGFPLPPACHDFLVHAFEPVYARDDRSRAALSGADGSLAEPGARVRPEGLAGSLELLAREGVDAFYRGELARRIVEHVRGAGGSLTAEDLAAYRAEVRRPLEVELDGWRVATNPPPARGGRRLAALLELSAERPHGSWDAGAVAWLVRAHLACLHRRVDDRRLPDRVVSRLEAGDGDEPGADGSPSTLHTSAVDGRGTICSVTMSDGYGSGVMPPGTGLWLNNCLGERELNPGGLDARPPGRRLPSNMAPVAARGAEGRRLAVGTPGSARIPTVLHQVMLNHVRLGMDLEAAVEHPRLHVEESDEGPRVACEPGLPTGELELPVRRFDGPDMYFGGGAAALREAGGGLVLAADPRRGGGTGVGGAG